MAERPKTVGLIEDVFAAGGKFFQTEGAADFRERGSRSIWPSKLCLSCDKFLLASAGVSFVSVGG